MRPYNDTLKDTLAGITDALENRPAPGGFIVCAMEGHMLLGALVMLNTGMSGYIPPNLLLFIAVDPEKRGQGIGTNLLSKSLENTHGPVKLHVEADNPARRLYERAGFRTAYLDMRLPREAQS